MSKTDDKKRGVGDAATEALRAGKTNEEALEAVQKEFPDAKTSAASINWYRNKLRSEGEDIPTARELRKASKDGAAPKAKAKKPVKATKKPAKKAKRGPSKVRKSDPLDD